MWFSLSEQTAYFLWSVVFGAGAAALYDLIRAVRMALRSGRVQLLIGDVLFFTVCGILTSLFALPFNNGSVRAFIIFGEAAGFLCWRSTIGRITRRIYSILSKLFLCIMKKICDLLKKIFDFLLKTTALVVYNISEIIEAVKNRFAVKLRKVSRSREKTRKRNGYERRHRKEKHPPHRG